MDQGERFVYVDAELAQADWSKASYDLIGVNTLADLADFVRMEPGSFAFRNWLREANNYPWVDDAPTEIRLAIRAHKGYEG